MKFLYKFYLKRIFFISSCIQFFINFVFLFTQIPIILNFLNTIHISIFQIFYLIFLELLLIYHYILFFSVLLSLVYIFYYDFIKNNTEILLMQCGVDKFALSSLLFSVVIFFIAISIYIKYFLSDINYLAYKFFIIFKENILSSIKKFTIYEIFDVQCFSFQDNFIVLKIQEYIVNVVEIIYKDNVFFIKNLSIYNDKLETLIQVERLDIKIDIESIKNRQNLYYLLINNIVSFCKAVSLYILFLFIPCWLYIVIFEKISFIKYIVSFLFLINILQAMHIVTFILPLFNLILLIVYLIYIRQDNA